MYGYHLSGCGPRGIKAMMRGRQGWGRHGPGGFGGPGWGRDGGGRRRRMFVGGELKLVLLKLIADEPRHGYDLIREIEALTGGEYAPSPGVVYPTLTLLEDMGQIAEQRSEGAKKLFAVTEAGQAELAEQAELVETLLARLAEIGKRAERTDGTPIRRSMGNLRSVLQNRLGGEEVDKEVLHEIAAIIDEAAQRIERL